VKSMMTAFNKLVAGLMRSIKSVFRMGKGDAA
jgi:hypothetical protein